MLPVRRAEGNGKKTQYRKSCRKGHGRSRKGTHGTVAVQEICPRDGGRVTSWCGTHAAPGERHTVQKKNRCESRDASRGTEDEAQVGGDRCRRRKANRKRKGMRKNWGPQSKWRQIQREGDVGKESDYKADGKKRDIISKKR